MVAATIIPTTTSRKNQKRERDPQMHQTPKGNQWFFAMKMHLGVKNSGLIHSVVTTAAHVSDVVVAAELLHGEEKVGSMGMQATKALRSERRWQDERWTVPSHGTWEAPPLT